MKLLYKTSLINILLASTLLLIGCGFLYYLMTNTLEGEIDEKLLLDKERVVEKIKSGEEITSIRPIIKVHLLDKKAKPMIDVKSTFLYDPQEEDVEYFRELKSIDTIDGKSYKITVRQIILEPQDYVRKIGFTIVYAWIFLIIGFFFVNWKLSSRIWQPFKNNLDALKKYKVGQNQPIHLETSSIKEFKELNTVISELTNKAIIDYNSLKEFTENAAHEMQTPLAIIQSKLDEALQYTNLTEDQTQSIHAALTASKRLAKLNQTLLFLTKIENKQFIKEDVCDLATEIEKALGLMNDFIETKRISILKNSKPQQLKIDHLLVETLLFNLIGNAIKYSITSGEIKITIENNSLLIENLSDEVIESPDKMFDRFTKANQSSSSHGLGLAIVKKICEQYNYGISYTIEGKWHRIHVLFS